MQETVFKYLKCEKKKKHETVRAALNHIERLKRSDRKRKGKRYKDNEGLNCYKCKYCGFYHVGHKK